MQELYTINEFTNKNGDATTNEGKLEIETTGDTLIGYDHFWGVRIPTY